MSDDTPTVRFDQPAPSGASGASGDGGDKAKKSRTLIIILSVVGGLLLIAIVILLTLLLSRGSGGPAGNPSAGPSVTPSETPSASPSVTPSASPSKTPSSAPPPPPPPSGPTFATFTAPTSAGCTVANPSSTITFSWSSADAVKAWFGVHTKNAKANPYEEVPTTDTYDFQYQCSNESEYYTVTLQDADGRLTSKTVTITKD